MALVRSSLNLMVLENQPPGLHSSTSTLLPFRATPKFGGRGLAELTSTIMPYIELINEQSSGGGSSLISPARLMPEKVKVRMVIRIRFRI